MVKINASLDIKRCPLQKCPTRATDFAYAVKLRDELNRLLHEREDSTLKRAESRHIGYYAVDIKRRKGSKTKLAVVYAPTQYVELAPNPSIVNFRGTVAGVPYGVSFKHDDVMVVDPPYGSDVSEMVFSEEELAQLRTDAKRQLSGEDHAAIIRTRAIVTSGVRESVVGMDGEAALAALNAVLVPLGAPSGQSTQ